MPNPIDINLLLRRAYHLLKKDMSKPEYVHIEPLAAQTLQRLHQDIQAWDGSAEISQFYKYWTELEANAVSAEGTAKVFKGNLETFLQDSVTREKVRKLLMLRKQEALDFRVINKAAEVGLIAHLDRCSFPSGRPLFYVHRMEIMIFSELFTSIADRKKLEDTASLLGINGNNVAFERLQFQTREKVDEFIQMEGLMNETKFVKRGIAWWIIDAAKELRRE
ncbi:hypothetical protein FHS16_005143 [Paenibacillus endophyticus]|uniref:Uncharacterized protein n=1 Tax=Paenibacillus endophyticus TaxID=1294268 RepID=A0A7W5GCN0_9BACL|nr:hypothetical protein [Paenibacillus endophyticus]MBB3155036.1 hypothetical protein [Paenibacillus endophyticus]